MSPKKKPSGKSYTSETKPPKGKTHIQVAKNAAHAKKEKKLKQRFSKLKKLRTKTDIMHTFIRLMETTRSSFEEHEHTIFETSL